MKRVAAQLALVLCATAVPCPAQEEPPAAPETSTDEVERCVSQHESARMLRLKEQWLDAREAMTRCADQSCPIAIRTDCSDWLLEVAQMIPTLLVVVERDDDGKQPVRLELDGRVLELPEQLGPIEVLPGKHQLTFTLASYRAVEHVVVLEKGQKNVVVRVRFAREPLPAAPKAPLQPAPLPAPRTSRPIPASTYLFAGGALAAFGVSGSLLASTWSSLSAARDTCKPGCKREDRESIEARLLTVDIVAGVGVLLSGLAVYSFARRPEIVERDAAVVPGLELGNGRAKVSIEGRF